MEDLGRMSEGLPPSENKVCAATKKKLLDEFRVSASSLANMFIIGSETLDEAYEQGFKDCLKNILQAHAKDSNFDIVKWAKIQQDRIKNNRTETDVPKRRQSETEIEALNDQERCARPNTPGEGKRSRTR